jgi:hypothetical protein
VYRETPTSRPYIFEAWNSSQEVMYPDEIKHGIAFTDLENRMSSYRGYIFYKQLSHQVSPGANMDFYGFIYWAMHNMKYNEHVILNGISKYIFNDSLRVGTNCGEIVYLSLIKLGILSPQRFHENRKHHLRDMCNITQTDSGNNYLPILYVWQNYFTIIPNRV